MNVIIRQYSPRYIAPPKVCVALGSAYRKRPAPCYEPDVGCGSILFSNSPKADIDQCFLYVGLGPRSDIARFIIDHLVGHASKFGGNSSPIDFAVFKLTTNT